jgi:hypothetical protein
MNCDVCNQEFANSEEVKRHKEQVHPMGDGKDPDPMENAGVIDESQMREPPEQRDK